MGLVVQSLDLFHALGRCQGGPQRRRKPARIKIEGGIGLLFIPRRPLGRGIRLVRCRLVFLMLMVVERLLLMVLLLVQNRRGRFLPGRGRLIVADGRRGSGAPLMGIEVPRLHQVRRWFAMVIPIHPVAGGDAPGLFAAGVFLVLGFGTHVDTMGKVGGSGGPCIDKPQGTASMLPRRRDHRNG